MEVRKYYADTVEGAFTLARRELGPDAMLLQSSQVEAGESGSRYEVVFAGEPLSGTAQAAAPVLPETPRAKAPAAIPGLVRAARISRAEIPFGPLDLVRARQSRSAPAQTPAVKAPAETRQPAVTRARCNPGLSRFASPSYTIGLVGPTGSGKTSTAMKLAVQYGLLTSRPCRMIAYDPERVGATERARHFCNLLKIPFQTAETPAELKAALTGNAPGLTLLDTPGCAPGEERLIASLAFLFGTQRDVEVQLTLRADRKLADNIAAGARFAPLAPKRLILTALDETADQSEVELLANALALPFSFFGISQKIPEGLRPASLELLRTLPKPGGVRNGAAAA